MAEEKEKGKKILIVEDDIPLKEMYQTRLEMEGYKVISAIDGEEALAQAVAENPDLILLDLMMPRIDGFAVLDILKSTPKISHIPVIILTALEQESNKVKGLAAGADDYLIKSQCMPKDVVAKIKEIIAKVDKNK